ncbi:hypothetical protein [Paraburkholderia xenovorans]|uniref:hypothetical protein n=1 Tax=Paraburkholderia xenovorans TaxID=36873 RepID=UPI0015C57B5B|nr:hypothetical protein [Paraburkholderia xenovorans]NPT35407.1 hypothetical protein [Paraburkholderia xenovorans]
MLSDLTSDQHDSPRCGHCGVPLAGRFTPCPSCHHRPVDAPRAHAAPRSSLKVPLNEPLNDPQSLVDSRLPARKLWDPSSRALVNSYEFVEEPAVAVSAYQRLRQPLVLAASALTVTSAVYLGFIHSNDSKVGTPIAVSGKVQTQNAAPLAVVPQKPAAAVTQRSATAIPQKSITILAQAQAPAAAVPQKPAAIVAAQKPASGAAMRSAPVRSPPAPPVAATPPLSRRVASVEPDAKRNPGGQSGKPPDKPRADVSRHLRAARADLQQNNLSATRVRLAAAISVQPDNRDALNMRATLSAREQQRDALLSLARGCGYIARWNCVSHNAGTALQIDSSSKEAQRLVMLAQHEAQLQIPPPVEPAPEPAPDMRDLNSHH